MNAKKAISSVIILTLLISSCNSGANSSNPTPQSSSMQTALPPLKTNLPASARLINPQDPSAFIDAQTNSLYILLSNGKTDQLVVSDEVKNALLLPDERAIFDYDIANSRYHIIIFGDGIYKNTRTVYNYNSINGTDWQMTHSFTPTNLSSDFIGINNELYAATTNNDLVVLDNSGNITPILGHTCDGSQILQLRRIHALNDINSPYSNILMATSLGNVCSYDTKTHALSKLVEGSKLPLEKVVVNAQGTQFAFINHNGNLYTTTINGEKIAEFTDQLSPTNNISHPDSIAYRLNGDLMISKSFKTASGTHIFSITLVKSGAKSFSPLGYYVASTGQPYFPTNNEVLTVTGLKWGWLNDVIAVVITVAVVAAAVAVSVATAGVGAPEATAAGVAVLDEIGDTAGLMSALNFN